MTADSTHLQPVQSVLQGLPVPAGLGTDGQPVAGGGHPVATALQGVLVGLVLLHAALRLTHMGLAG